MYGCKTGRNAALPSTTGSTIVVMGDENEKGIALKSVDVLQWEVQHGNIFLT